MELLYLFLTFFSQLYSLIYSYFLALFYNGATRIGNKIKINYILDGKKYTHIKHENILGKCLAATLHTGYNTEGINITDLIEAFAGPDGDFHGASLTLSEFLHMNGIREDNLTSLTLFNHDIEELTFYPADTLKLQL